MSGRFTAVPVAVSAAVTMLVFQFWFGFTATPSFLYVFEWLAFGLGGAIIFTIALLISLALTSL